MTTLDPPKADLKLADGYDQHLKRNKAIRAGIALPGLMGTRLLYDTLGEHYSQTYSRPAGMRVRNTFIVKRGYEIPLRIYWPTTEPGPAIIVYFHGGGWVGGSHDSHEMIIAELAQATGAVVVSVHYRRAPENPYPAMHEDCYDGVLWAVENQRLYGWNADRLAVAGDSSGGLLSTAMCMLTKARRGPRIRHASLIYGVFDFDGNRPYYRTAQDQTLTLDIIRQFAAAYLEGRETTVTDPVAVPNRAQRSDLEGLPPAYFLNAEYDFLLEEELEYAAKLRDAGVDVTIETVAGTMHGFLRAMDVCPAARQAFDRLASAIKRHLSRNEAG